MDFGLGSIQHLCAILDFQGVLLLRNERISQRKNQSRRKLSMGVVTGIVSSSEAMAQTMCFFLPSSRQDPDQGLGQRPPAHLRLIALPHQARFSGGPFP